MKPPKLILIPCLLGEGSIDFCLPNVVCRKINTCDVFIVENLRSARRFLIKAGLKKSIDDLIFYELNKHTNPIEIPSFLDPIKQNKNIGLLSDAGCPGIADPGAEIVKLAHQLNIKVEPLVGPSSILLALISSGLNGQNFAFNGYLPSEKNERRKKIKFFEKISFTNNQTQIFIETPFRNKHLYNDLLKFCDPNTELVLACDLTLESQFIKRKKIKNWRENDVNLHKRPCVFILHKY